MRYLAFLLFISMAAAIELVGCYSSVDTSDSQGTQQYQTSSLCALSCPDSPYIALKNGNECYCLSKKPSGSSLASGCNVGCFGFGSQMCGGSSAYSVYTGNGSASDDTSETASASETASSSQTSSSASSSTSSKSKSSSTSASATSETAQEVTSTRSQDGSVVVKTVTALASATSSSSASKSTSSPLASSSSDAQKKESGGTKVGPIVGGVVGGVAAIVIVSLIAFFLVRKRRQDEDHDEEEFYDKPEMARGGTNKLKRNKPASPLDRPMSNPFTDPSEAMVAAGGGKLGLVDPRLNPMMMGRRRLSEGSLADETDYSRKILQVANPDN